MQTVGVIEGTVGNFEKTVAFINATNFLKEEKGVKFLDIGKMLGLNKGQMNMVRIKRRYITSKEVDTLLQAYPDVAHFLKKKEYTNIQGDDTNNKLHEDMDTGHYGRKVDTIEPWRALAHTQKRLIEELEQKLKGLEEVTERLTAVEIENKMLKELISKKD